VAIVLIVALTLRLAHWAVMRRAPFIGELVMDSQEYDRWARQIAAGDWLGHGVFFQAPLYPYLVALLYVAFGRSLDAVYLAQIGVSVAGCYALYRAGAAMGGERVGLAAAALAAVYGPFLFYDVQLLKESLAVSVVCFLLWALARAVAPERRGAGPWFLAGALLGVLSLLRENALLVVPFLLPLTWWPARRGRRDGAIAGLVLLGGVALVLAPVALRNGLVGGSFLPTTFQGGVNFYIGNNAEADGTYRPIVPGKQVPELERREPIRIAETALGRPLTAAQVSTFWLRRSLSWTSEHPGAFVLLTLRKVGLYWSWYEWPDAVDYYFIRSQSPVFRLPLLEFGGVTLLLAAGLVLLLRLLRRRPEAAPLLPGGPLALAPALLFAAAWMASTVLFFLFARYRLPAVPALLLVAALPLAGLAAPGPRPHRLLLAAVVAAAFVLPRLAGFAPRLDLVHFNLGRLAEERGDADLARRHYLAVLDASPGDFLAWLDLGSLAARQRDWAQALRCYTRAAELQPRSDDAQADLGAIYVALGDPRRAEEHLGQALALNAQSAPALQNWALLRLRLGDLTGARELNRRALDADPANASAGRLRARLSAARPAPP
jgi:tetratricopeptide (TPR) repeat protein